MYAQTLKIVSTLIVSLLIGIIVTLLADKVENVSVEKRIRSSLENDIRHAVASFSGSTAGHSSADIKSFVKEYVGTVMKGKVTVSERAAGSAAGRGEDARYLFSLSGDTYVLDFSIDEPYLRSELALLDVPAYIAGITAVIVVFTFIVLYTESRKRALQMRMQFEQKEAELQSALAQSEALALLGRMSAALAHELKTPFATISNLVQTLPSRRNDEQFVGRFVALTREELSRTQQLIDNLLAYGKEIDVRNSEWIDVVPVLTDAAGGRLALDISRTFMIYGDRFYLGILFKNIFRNSREAGADTVTVRVNIPSVNDRRGEILCDDNGSGISAAVDLERLLDPFVTSRSRGGGLGLYLARKIIMAHGGSLSLERMNRGARVIIRIPADRIRLHDHEEACTPDRR